ncbi:MAG: DUF6527 family protein [Pseudomonadota bacterium]
MGVMLSPILRQIEPGRVAFWCPGCKELHQIPVGPQRRPGVAWGYNGDPEKPTFTPSLLVRSGHYAPGWNGPECWCTDREDGEDWGFGCFVCHTFVTDGHIQFLGDCTHELAGQTVPLPPIPEPDRG